RPWQPQAGQALRAAISSFGYSGTNAPLVLEQYSAPHHLPNGELCPVVVLSAKNEERLKEQAERLLQAIAVQGLTQADLPRIAYTLQVGREAFAVRLACVVRTIEELTLQLERYCQGQQSMPNFYLGSVRRNNNGVQAFEADEEMQEA